MNSKQQQNNNNKPVKSAKAPKPVKANVTIVSANSKGKVTAVKSTPFPVKSRPSVVVTKVASTPRKSGKEEIVIDNHSPTKQHVSTRLDMVDPYLRTIADPWGVRGIQIPDDVTEKSSTFSVIDRQTLTTNASGIASVAYGVACTGNAAGSCGSLVPVKTQVVAQDFAVGMIGVSGQDTANLFYKAPSFPTPFTFSTWNSTSATIPNLYSQARLVSGGVRITFTGNLTNAQGVITIVCAPRDWLRYSKMDSGSAISISLLQSHPSAKLISVPRCYGGEGIYVPLDPLSIVYTDLDDTFTQAAFPDQIKGMEIYAVVTGGAASQTFQVEAIFNYEGIPQTNQYNPISSRVSKSDPISMAHTMNVVPELPVTRGMSELKPDHILGSDILSPADDAPGHTETEAHPSQDITLMDQIFNGLDKAWKFGSSVFEKAAPFLEML